MHVLQADIQEGWTLFSGARAIGKVLEIFVAYSFSKDSCEMVCTQKHQASQFRLIRNNDRSPGENFFIRQTKVKVLFLSTECDSNDLGQSIVASGSFFTQEQQSELVL